MATSLSQTINVLEYGVMGSILSIPANYNHSMIVFYSSKGINKGIREWGQMMQRAYNRTNQHRLNDLTINYLGYYTDNGAYYYYNTEKGINYEETIINVYHQIPLPFHYIQLDSWWYYKGIRDGVTEWTGRPDIFPDAHDWGLVLYEQDWLDRQTIDFLPTRTDIHIGQQWLMSMGEAGEKVGINIQYCMNLPRHILQALQIPRVTHARTSIDYAVHLVFPIKAQWAIGISSMLADAIGLAPFKDVFWSSSFEPGARLIKN
ncbi:unnamed protein product [Rotaria sp. Silwood1]|nr:unnamed protein product [Rotaria sp. Silwood1]